MKKTTQTQYLYKQVNYFLSFYTPVSSHMKTSQVQTSTATRKISLAYSLQKIMVL